MGCESTERAKCNEKSSLYQVKYGLGCNHRVSALYISAIILGISCQAYQPAPSPPPTPEPTPTPAPTPTPEVAGIEVVVTARFATYQPLIITVAKGQTVKLTITSTDASRTFTVDELGINVAVGVGETATKEFTVEKTGTPNFYCAVPGYRSAGMEGTLEATG